MIRNENIRLKIMGIVIPYLDKCFHENVYVCRVGKYRLTLIIHTRDEINGIGNVITAYIHAII